ncbi:hypothetical protein ABK040_016234 [Willaertia magna]
MFIRKKNSVLKKNSGLVETQEKVYRASTKQQLKRKLKKLKTIKLGIDGNNKKNQNFKDVLVKNALTLLIQEATGKETQEINQKNKVTLFNNFIKELTQNSTNESNETTINTDEKELTVEMFDLIIDEHNIFSYRWEFERKITKNVFEGKLIGNSNSNTCSVIAKIDKTPLEGSIRKTLTFYRSNDNIVFSLKGKALTEIEFKNSKEVLHLMVDLLIDLYNLHFQKVIHNDIKPQNIVQFKNMFKFIDFGISHKYIKYDEQNEQCFTKENKVLISKSGTKGYFPPEQLENGNGEITPKSDIYSLGLVITSIVLSPLRKWENHTEVFSAINRWKPNDEIYKAIKEVLLGMLEVEKVKRLGIKECIKALLSHYELDVNDRIKIYNNFNAKEYLPAAENISDSFNIKEII